MRRSSPRQRGCLDSLPTSRSPVPEPIAIGEPGVGYPYRWAVHRWILGDSAALDRVDDPLTFALDLADVVCALQGVARDDAPPAYHRARPLHEYDEAARRAIDGASHLIDAAAATAVWEEALVAPPHAPRTGVGSRGSGGKLPRARRAGCAESSTGAQRAQATLPSTCRSCGRRCSPTHRVPCFSTCGVDAASLARSRGAVISQACAALPYYLNTYPADRRSVVAQARRLGVEPLADP